MHRSVRFFKNPVIITEDIKQFNTPSNCLEQAREKPDELVKFLEKEFEGNIVQEGRHPILGDLITFCRTLEDKAYEAGLPNPNIMKVSDYLQKFLVKHYQSFALCHPKTCASLLEIDMTAHPIYGKKHDILGDLKNVYAPLPANNAVYALLHPIWLRANYLSLASTEPDEVIAYLEKAFQQQTIKAGDDPLLGNMLTFAYDVEKYKRNYYQENKVTAFLKLRLFEHYQALANTNVSICLAHIEQEDALRHFTQAKHLIFGDIDTFIKTLTSEEANGVKVLLSNIQKLERLAAEAICKPTTLKNRLVVDFKAGKINNGIHEDYGDLRKLAQKIYEDAPEPAEEGKHPVLSLFEAKKIWSYPPATHNPINGRRYSNKNVDSRQRAIDAFYARQEQTPEALQAKTEPDERHGEHDKGSMRKHWR